MKKIDINKLNKIKTKHFDYCKKLPEVSDLTDEHKKMLFINNPFTDNMQAKKVYKESFSKIDLIGKYENFRKYKKTKWNGVELINELGITVCPYCGMNYFSTVTKNKNGKTVSVATLDHYLPKNNLKMLALNIYNLVPCCKNCNSTFKGSSTKTIINPYFYSLEENLKFEIPSEDITSMLVDDNKKLHIEIKNTAKENVIEKLINDHFSVLSLKERYGYFDNIAKSIIKKKIYYNSTYISELENYTELNLTKSDIETMLMCQDIFDDNEPFLKFKKDIWEQI